jgi:hypothetical protein
MKKQTLWRVRYAADSCGLVSVGTELLIADTFDAALRVLARALPGSCEGGQQAVED